MSSCSVTLSANAGICLELDGKPIWIDAVHRHKVEGFSTVSPELWARMCADGSPFRSPELLIFTHRHPDHYSHTLIAEALSRWPQVRVISPVDEFRGQLVLHGARQDAHIGTLELRFFALPHERELYRDTPNYGILISNGAHTILLAGDSEVAAPQLAEAVAGRRIDLAILNFPWLCLQKGRRFLEQTLRPEHLLLFHLPFACDDTQGYRKAAAFLARRATQPADIRLLLEPMQQERYAL